MKIKILTLSVYCLLYWGQSFAQRRQNVYFLKNSGAEVTKRDSADFIRVVSEPDSGSTLYNVSELYLNDKPKLIGKTSQVDYLRLEGQAMTFYSSGKKQTVVTYKNGIKIGDAYEYYPNGKLYVHKQYLQSKVNPNSTFGEKFSIIDCWDSTGKQLVINGNGYYTGYDKTFKNIKEEGNVKSGLRNGEWKGEDKFEKLTFKESYNNGELLSGESVDEGGKIYTYKDRELAPEFKGGINGFTHFLVQTIRYPAEARMRNIQGKVIVTFTV